MASPLLLAIADDGDRRSITPCTAPIRITAAQPPVVSPVTGGRHPQASIGTSATAAERLHGSLSSSGALLTLRSAIN